MRSAHLSRRQAEAVAAGGDYEAVSAVQEWYVRSDEVMDSSMSPVAFHALLESMEKRLGIGPTAEAAGLALDHRNPHPYRRTRRRNAKRVLRDLVEVPLAELIEADLASEHDGDEVADDRAADAFATLVDLDGTGWAA